MSYLTIAKEAEARLGLSDEPVASTVPDPGAPDPLSDALARLLGLPLDRFAAEGQPLEVRVPWWPTTHFFVPTLRDLVALTREGIGRERIWLPAELAELVEAGASVEAHRGPPGRAGVWRRGD